LLYEEKPEEFLLLFPVITRFPYKKNFYKKAESVFIFFDEKEKKDFFWM